jgi:hypothetical protein
VLQELHRRLIEPVFGEEMSGAHTRASTELDMFLLASILFSSGLSMPRGSRQLAGLQPFDSHDILRTGVDVLAEKIKDFNRVHIQDPRSTVASYPPLDADDQPGFVDIQEFADSIGDRLEEVDLTSDLHVS